MYFSLEYGDRRLVLTKCKELPKAMQRRRPQNDSQHSPSPFTFLEVSCLKHCWLRVGPKNQETGTPNEQWGLLRFKWRHEDEWFGIACQMECGWRVFPKWTFVGKKCLRRLTRHKVAHSPECQKFPLFTCSYTNVLLPRCCHGCLCMQAFVCWNNWLFEAEPFSPAVKIMLRSQGSFWSSMP